jgi:hypothetical protein
MNSIFHLMDELESLIKGGKAVPFSSGKIFVESDRVLEVLDRLRAIIPEELETAKQIIANKENIMQSAYSEADEYLTNARERSSRMVDDNEITAEALQKSELLLERAQKMAEDVRVDADMYADEVLTHMEMVLKRGLDAVIAGKEQLRASVEYDDEEI